MINLKIDVWLPFQPQNDFGIMAVVCQVRMVCNLISAITLYNI
jgi:hypothetical protein